MEKDLVSKLKVTVRIYKSSCLVRLRLRDLPYLTSQGPKNRLISNQIRSVKRQAIFLHLENNQVEYLLLLLVRVELLP